MHVVFKIPNLLTSRWNVQFYFLFSLHFVGKPTPHRMCTVLIYQEFISFSTYFSINYQLFQDKWIWSTTSTSFCLACLAVERTRSQWRWCDGCGRCNTLLLIIHFYLLYQILLKTKSNSWSTKFEFEVKELCMTILFPAGVSQWKESKEEGIQGTEGNLPQRREETTSKSIPKCHQRNTSRRKEICDGSLP